MVYHVENSETLLDVTVNLLHYLLSLGAGGCLLLLRGRSSNGTTGKPGRTNKQKMEMMST